MLSLVKFRSLQFKLISLVVLITTLLTAFSLFELYESLSQGQHASFSQLRNRIADHLNYAAGIQAKERSVGNTIIGGNHDLTGMFRELAAKGDASTQKAEEISKQILELDFTNSDFRNKVSDWKRDLEALRQARSRVEKGEISTTEWLDITTMNISNEFELRDLAFSSIDESESIIYYNTLLRPNVATLAEYAGRERALLGNILASGKVISADEMANLKRYRSRVERALNNIFLLKGQTKTPAELENAIRKFEDVFLGSFETLRQKIYSASRRTEEVTDAARLKLSDIKRDVLDVLHGIDDKLQSLADSPHLKIQVGQIIQGSEQDFSLVNSAFEAINNIHHEFDQMRYLDASGRERTRVDYIGGNFHITPGAQLQDKSNRYYFREVNNLPHGGVFISPMDLNIERGNIEVPFKPVLRYGAPVFYNGLRQGIVILNVFANRILEKLPIYITLVDMDGYFLQHPDSSKEWGMMKALGRETANLSQEFPEVANRFFSGKQALIKTRDVVYLTEPIHYNPSAPGKFWVLFLKVEPAPYPVDSTLWMEKATNAIDAALAISESAGKLARDTVQSQQSFANFIITLSTLLVTIVSVALFLFFKNFLSVGRRVRNISDGLRNLTEGDLGHRINLPEGVNESGSKAALIDEVDTIAVSINQMAENLQESMRKLAEETKREAEERNRLLLESAAEGIYGLDVDGRSTFVNLAVCEMLGFTAEELIGHSMHSLIHHSYPDGSPYPEKDCFVYASIRDGKVHNITNEVLWRKNGTSIPVEYTSKPIRKKCDVVGAVVTFRDITERKRSEETIKASLEEKDVLLKEIHHRVKNNLQVISSMLALQANAEDNENISAALLDSERRVRIMAQAHENLYRSDDLAHIDARNYIETIIDDLKESYLGEFERVLFIKNIDPIVLDIERAILIGQIISELLSNALKYAFPDNRSGEIEVSLKQLDGKRIELSVADYGIGLPKDFDIAESKTLGLQLVDTLARILKGELIISNQPGACFQIVLDESEM